MDMNKDWNEKGMSKKRIKRHSSGFDFRRCQGCGTGARNLNNGIISAPKNFITTLIGKACLDTI